MSKELTVAAEQAANKLGNLMGYDGKALIEQMAMVSRKIKPETIVRATLTAFTKTPKLRSCTKESLFLSLMNITALGLTPDGRNCHLIPYGKECQVIVDYKGLVAVAKRDGDIANVYAELVCENDDFEYNMGKVTKHIIDFKSDRGKPYAVYSHATYKNGLEDYEVMQQKDVMAIKKRSKAGSSGPWVTDEYEMWKKTVIRRHSKRWNFEDGVDEALQNDFDNLPSLKDVVTVSAEVVEEEKSGVARGAVNAEDLFTEEDEVKEEPKKEGRIAERVRKEKEKKDPQKDAEDFFGGEDEDGNFV